MIFKIHSVNFHDLLTQMADKTKLSDFIAAEDNIAVQDNRGGCFKSDRDLADLFSPISDFQLFEDIDSNPAKLAQIQTVITNFTAFLDHLIQLVVPEDQRADVELDLDKSIKLSIKNGTDYRITNTDSWLAFSEIIFRRTANQITALSYKDKAGLKHSLIEDSKPIDIKPVTDLFKTTELSSVKDQSAFFFDKARRLLEMQANPKLAALVPDMFFVNPTQINNQELFEQSLVRLNHQGPIIVRSAHVLEGSPELPLSGVFSSIPNVNPTYEDFVAATNHIKQDDSRLTRINYAKQEWAKLSMDDLGLIVMPQIQTKYSIKIEPVVYNSDRQSIEAKSYSFSDLDFLGGLFKHRTKDELADKQVSFEIKIWDSGALVYRSDLADLKPQSIISQAQIDQIKTAYQELSSQYSQEFQEAEFLIDMDDRLHLVQTRDQAAIEKHPDDDISAKLLRYSLLKRDLDDSTMSGIAELFSDEYLPMIVIDESQAWYRFLYDKQTPLKFFMPEYDDSLTYEENLARHAEALPQAILKKDASFEYDPEVKAAFLQAYRERISDLAKSLGSYQLFVKDISLSNEPLYLVNPEDRSREFHTVSAYEDIVSLAEVCFANDIHVLRNGSGFHNLLFTGKSRHATVQLPKESGAFSWLCTDEKGERGYNPRTGLLKNPGSPKQLVEQLMWVVKHDDCANRSLDIDIADSAIHSPQRIYQHVSSSLFVNQ